MDELGVSNTNADKRMEGESNPLQLLVTLSLDSNVIGHVSMHEYVYVKINEKA